METSAGQSKTKIIASTNVFQIEKIEKIGKADYPKLIEISLHLEKYFNTEKSLPFIARYQNEIIGYIIGIPLEELNMEPWALNDENYGKHNTLYTYAFVIMEKYKSNGYAKMLKRVYLSWAQKRDRIRYITGHVLSGTADTKDNSIKIISFEENWQGTGKSFEYYRRSFNEGLQSSIFSPPFEIIVE